MSYTAIEKMRNFNKQRFGEDLGPMQPGLYVNRQKPNDLKSAALRFLHKRCVGLRFDEKIEKEEEKTGIYQGKSLKAGQIPYNMQMDINRLCLEKALETFIDSGVAEDAYSVYYCYLEIFFGEYGKSRRMVELLSEYETNGSSLLMKHRDHYSHSVFVFALGLAIYETNKNVRNAFGKFYKCDPESCEAAKLFLEYWGLTSLFHDIGYPFELPFEQVLSYFEVDNKKRGKGSLYLSYRSVESLTMLDEESKACFEKLYKRKFSTTNELLAYDITKKLGKAYGFTEKYMKDVLDRKPTNPEDFGYFMDHAFFSATRLYQEFITIFGAEKLNKMHVDVLSAIMLHNSLYKFNVAYYKDKEKKKAPLKIELHPLAWLLMICDELQCWDRRSYGRNTRKELHPTTAGFDFKNGGIYAEYYYDSEEQAKIKEYDQQFKAWKADPIGKKPRLKAYSDMVGDRSDFTLDIESIVDTSVCPLTVRSKLRRFDRDKKHTYLSESNFLHFFDFAVALRARNMPEDTPFEEMEKMFRSSSLEYQLSTLGRARHFATYLNAIGCFFTDNPVDFELVTRFTPKDVAIFAPMEHERWMREHQAMGWHYGKAYETLPLDVKPAEEKVARDTLREQLRCHKLVMDGKISHDEIRAHYQRMPKAYKDKDGKPFNNLLLLLKKYEGTRIYRL